MFLRLSLVFVAVVGLTGLVAAQDTPADEPEATDAGEDLRACDNDDLSWEVRREACTRLIDDKDRDPVELAWIHAARGNSFYFTREYEAALSDFSVAIAIDPANPSAYLDRGAAFLWLDRYEDALSDFDRAIELDPRTDSFYFHRGLTNARAGRPTEALADYDQALLLDPDDQRALVARGYLHLRNGRPDRARADFTVAIEVAPFSAGIYAGRGEISAEQGDVAAAIRDLRIAEILDPNLGAPGILLPNLVEDRSAATQTRSLEFTPPAEGLRITYIGFVVEVEPDVEDIEAAIMELVYFFSGPPEIPLPISRAALAREMGPTKGNVSTTSLANALEPDGLRFALDYDHSLFALMEVGRDVPEGTRFNYQGVDEIWRLSPGQQTAGVGDLGFLCPEEPNPMAVFLGCEPGISSVPVGAIEWQATFVGWEYVLVPAGQRLTARITYTETRSFGGGKTVNTNTVWYDPEINWWIKRETRDRKLVQTEEAWTIELP